MTNPLLQKVAEIESWFAPNPLIVREQWESGYKLVRVQEPDRLVIEIHQFIFTRARIVIPHNECNAWLVTCGRCDIGGDLQSLRNALINDGYIKSKPEILTQLFTRAKKPVNSYPRKGKVSRKKRRA